MKSPKSLQIYGMHAIPPNFFFCKSNKISFIGELIENSFNTLKHEIIYFPGHLFNVCE